MPYDDWEHLLPPPSHAKEAKFHRVAWAVATALLRKGEEGLRVADVARRAGVSRAWVYKYFGQNTHDILLYALRLFGPAFAAPSVEEGCDVDAWREGLALGMQKGLHDVQRVPWCVAVYFRYRHANGAFADALRTLESQELERWREKMPERLRKRSDSRHFVRTFHAARMGLLFAAIEPGAVDASDVERLLGMVDRFVEKGPPRRQDIS
jgi:AcrR family transcriptional regulator